MIVFEVSTHPNKAILDASRGSLLVANGDSDKVRKNGTINLVLFEKSR